jgi:hypothetical protein
LYIVFGSVFVFFIEGVKMADLGTIRVTRDADRMPSGFELTSAPLDLLICMSIPYYTCIIGWDKLANEQYKPIFRRAIREGDIKRVNDVLLYSVFLKQERKNKRKKV